VTTDSKGKVLLVDDEAMVRDSLREWLAMEGYLVHAAASGEEAVHLVNAYSFDVGVFDIRMPGMDGFTLLSKVREMQPEMEVVMMTAYGTIEIALQCIQGGAYDYVIKPFPPEKLTLLVQQIRQRQNLVKLQKLLTQQLTAWRELVQFRDWINLGIYQHQLDAKDLPLAINGESEINLAILLAGLGPDPRVALTLSPSLPTVRGNPAFVLWAVVNCLDNAYRASQTGDKILISAEMMDHRRVAVMIRNQGRKITAPERLFEPYYSDWPDGKGQGLGLWASRYLLQSMQGRLEVKANSAGGTTATLVFMISQKIGL